MGDLKEGEREGVEVSMYVLWCIDMPTSISRKPSLGSNLKNLLNNSCRGCAKLADGHGDALVEDTRELLLYVQTTTLLQG